MNRITYGVAAVSIGLLCPTGTWAQAPAKKSPQGQAPALIASIQGPESFQAYCASCHGKDGKGTGPMANSLKTKPPDLTQIASRNNGAFQIARVQRVISGEEALPGGHGSREMPVWGPVFSQVTNDMDLGRVRIDNLARYLRDIQVAKSRK